MASASMRRRSALAVSRLPFGSTYANPFPHRTLRIAGSAQDTNVSDPARAAAVELRSSVATHREPRANDEGRSLTTS
jgi:hypothetical protein